MTTSEKARKQEENMNRAMSKAPSSSAGNRGCLIRLGDVGQPCGIRVASLSSRRGVAVDIDSCLGSIWTDNVDWLASRWGLWVLSMIVLEWRRREARMNEDNEGRKQ
jgi:hypothetical protein